MRGLQRNAMLKANTQRFVFLVSDTLQFAVTVCIYWKI